MCINTVTKYLVGLVPLFIPVYKYFLFLFFIASIWNFANCRKMAFLLCFKSEDVLLDPANLNSAKPLHKMVLQVF